MVSDGGVELAWLPISSMRAATASLSACAWALSSSAAAQLVAGKITDATTEIAAGKLGPKQIVDHVVLLGEPLVFTKANIEQYQF